MNREKETEKYLATMNKLCDGLRSIGVDATPASEERIKQISPKWGDTPYSYIEIKQSPIQLLHFGWGSAPDYGDYSFIHCVVPDSRHLPDNVHIWVYGVYKFWVFGRLVDVEWQLDDRSTGGLWYNRRKLSKRQRLELIKHLRDDDALKAAIMSSDCFGIVITSIKEPNGYWYICRTHRFTQDLRRAPSREEWRCYEKLAARLLTAPIPS